LNPAAETAPAAAPLPPGSWLGLLGGGQLGRMFCMAAQSMGYKVCVLDPGGDSPAGTVADRHIKADYVDPAALQQMARLCRAATTEFENVPARSLEFLAEHCIVSPAASCVSIAQERMREKRFVKQCGIDVAPYAEIHAEADLDAAIEPLFPAILKVARLGYDGKGQARVGDRDAALRAFREFGAKASVLEKHLSLYAELSVVVVRGFDGATLAYPVAENVHRGGILACSTVPARVAPAVAERAIAATLEIARQMNYVGVLCVEFFLLADGELIVNELAPRPHNSGHYTIDACVTSQFEQQVRVLAGLPLGSVHQHQRAVMLNILGDAWYANGGGAPREPDWRFVVRHPRAKLHVYGKAEARRGRKMGHVTVLGDSLGDAEAAARVIERDLGISAD
jgi:5-(carboxyamino)imidazole ribonucleotide synthase